MRRPGPDEWRKLIAEFEESELQQKEFAAKYELSLSSFQFWLYKLRRMKRSGLGSDSESNSGPRFLPVTVVASPAPKAREGVLEAVTRGGVAVRFVVGTDTRYLAELFAALG